MTSKFVPYLGVPETVDEIATSGATKCNLGFGQLFLLGFIAACYLSFATAFAFVSGTGVPIPGLQKLVMGLVFPIGLIALVVGGGEMWTGSAMSAPVAALTGKSTWKMALYALIGAYVGDFAGGLFCSWLLIHGCDLFAGPGYAGTAWIEMIHKAALMKVSLTFGQAYWRALACVWLVDLAVYLSFRSKDSAGKFFLIWFPTATFFTLGLEHSVVNMFLIPAAIMSGADITWSQFFLSNQLPVTLGNATAGALCVGAGYWYSAGMPVLKSATKSIDGHFSTYFSSHPLYVHANSKYALKAILSLGAVIIGLAVLMPGVGYALTFFGLEGATSHKAGTMPTSTDAIAMFGEPIIVLVVFIVIVLAWIKIRNQKQTVDTIVTTAPIQGAVTN